jgi:peptide/nickel transport system substrate-binding protein/oligopeptide transport system substrate-binding protein
LADDEVKGLDPQTRSDVASLRVAADQFEGLTRFDAAGNAEPGSRPGWQQSADGLVWRFRLRPGLAFSDGTPIAPELFPRLLARLRDPATASPHVGLVAAIAAITADGPDVVVRLGHPFPALPELLAHPALAALPLHRVARRARGGRRSGPLVTSGALSLTHWVLNDHVRLERNPRANHPPAPAPALEWATGRRPPDRHAHGRGGRGRHRQRLSADPPRVDCRAHPGAAHAVPYRGSYYFAFNTRLPPFDDARVRLRSPSPSIAAGSPSACSDRASDRCGAWSPAARGSARGIGRHGQTGRTRRLARRGACWRRRGGARPGPLSFEIRFNSDGDHRGSRSRSPPCGGRSGSGRRCSTARRRSISPHCAAATSARASGWIGDLGAPENFLDVHRSDAGAINYSGYANPRLRSRARPRPGGAAARAARAALFAEAEAILMADAPVLPIATYVSRSLVGPRVRGWRDNPANVHPSRTLAVVG